MAIQIGEWDEDLTPARFTRYGASAPDKAKILKALKAKETVPGFEMVRGAEGVSVK